MHRPQPFNRQQIQLQPISERGHGLSCNQCLPSIAPNSRLQDRGLNEVAKFLLTARQNHRSTILMTGAHPIKLGLSRFIIDLIERRLITHVATNGAGIIHDFELALVGGTSEDVAKWIKRGQFGLWQETSRLNDIIRDGAERNEGLGEAVGRVIEEECFPHRDLSIAAAGYRCGIPVTCHVSIGSDIIHAHPNCDGAALGQTSYTDFLIFARSVQDLEGGVFFNVGTAVTGPEVFLKALSMARNVAHQQGETITNFTTAVFDLAPLPKNWRDGTPDKTDPQYYYRPWKTLLDRTVADGGQSYYIQGNHQQTIPTLWQTLVEQSEARTGARNANS